MSYTILDDRDKKELQERINNKIELPKDNDGNIITGTLGQFAVADGKGGITWQTITNGNEVAY